MDQMFKPIPTCCHTLVDQGRGGGWGAGLCTAVDTVSVVFIEDGAVDLQLLPPLSCWSPSPS